MGRVSTRYTQKGSRLSTASERGYLRLVTLLLARGANVNAAIDNGRTSVFVAAQRGHKEVVDVLTAHGADTRRKDNHGLTALICAGANDDAHVVRAIIRARAASGVSPILDPDEAVSMLHGSVFNGTPGHAAVVEALLKEGRADANVLNKVGMPLIFNAAAGGRTECVRMIIQHGADVNARGRDGMTSLMTAAANGYTEIVTLLLAANADTSLKDDRGWKAVTYASKYGHKGTVQLLVSHQQKRTLVSSPSALSMPSAAAPASPSAPVQAAAVAMAASEAAADDTASKASIDEPPPAGVQSRGDLGLSNAAWASAFMSAVKGGHRPRVEALLSSAPRCEVDKWLKSTKIGTKALMAAAAGGYVDIVRELLRHGVDVHATDEAGGTALRAAAELPSVDVMRLLLSSGVDVNRADRHGQTCLMQAACVDVGGGVVAMLLSHGADARTATKDGTTALMCAAKRGWVMVVKMLVRHGVTVSAQDSMGRNALMHAAVHGHWGLLLPLLPITPDLATRDHTGNTVLTLASTRAPKAVLELLRLTTCEKTEEVMGGLEKEERAREAAAEAGAARRREKARRMKERKKQGKDVSVSSAVAEPSLARPVAAEINLREGRLADGDGGGVDAADAGDDDRSVRVMSSLSDGGCGGGGCDDGFYEEGVGGDAGRGGRSHYGGDPDGETNALEAAEQLQTDHITDDVAAMDAHFTHSGAREYEGKTSVRSSGEAEMGNADGAGGGVAPATLAAAGAAAASAGRGHDDEDDASIELDEDDLTDASRAFECPITWVVMRDPVMACDGHTYERRHIELWIRKLADGGMPSRSPLTNQPMEPQLVPNYALKYLIDGYLNDKLRNKKASRARAV